MQSVIFLMDSLWKCSWIWTCICSLYSFCFRQQSLKICGLSSNGNRTRCFEFLNQTFVSKQIEENVNVLKQNWISEMLALFPRHSWQGRFAESLTVLWWNRKLRVFHLPENDRRSGTLNRQPWGKSTILMLWLNKSISYPQSYTFISVVSCIAGERNPWPTRVLQILPMSQLWKGDGKCNQFAITPFGQEMYFSKNEQDTGKAKVNREKQTEEECKNNVFWLWYNFVVRKMVQSFFHVKNCCIL